MIWVLPFSVFLAVPLMIFDASRPGVWQLGRLARGLGVALMLSVFGVDWARLMVGGVARWAELVVIPVALASALAVVLGEHLAEKGDRGFWLGQKREVPSWELWAEFGTFVGIVSLNLGVWIAAESALDPAWLGGFAAVIRNSLIQLGWALGETAFYSAYLTLSLRAKLRAHTAGATLAVVGGALIFTFQHVAGPWTALRYFAIFPAGLFLAVIFLRRGFWVTTAVHWLLTLATTGAAAAWTAR